MGKMMEILKGLKYLGGEEIIADPFISGAKTSRNITKSRKMAEHLESVMDEIMKTAKNKKHAMSQKMSEGKAVWNKKDSGYTKPYIQSEKSIINRGKMDDVGPNGIDAMEEDELYDFAKKLTGSEKKIAFMEPDELYDHVANLLKQKGVK